MNLLQIILVQTEINVCDTHYFSNTNDTDTEEVGRQNNNFYSILKSRNIGSRIMRSIFLIAFCFGYY